VSHIHMHVFMITVMCVCMYPFLKKITCAEVCFCVRHVQVVCALMPFAQSHASNTISEHACDQSCMCAYRTKPFEVHTLSKSIASVLLWAEPD
jgi:hypothetical protein